MSIERSRHSGLAVVRKPAPLTAEDTPTDPASTALASDAWISCFIDVELGEATSAVVSVQLFARGDRANPDHWCAALGAPIPPIKRSGRFYFTFATHGSKNYRVLVRGTGAKLDGSLCAVEFRWRE
jgi:hypothetical protein